MEIGETSTNVPRNLEEKGGGFAHATGRLENAAAVAISLPPGSAWRKSEILRRYEEWRSLSETNGNIPVIVTTQYDRAYILIQGNAEPVELIWE